MKKKKLYVPKWAKAYSEGTSHPKSISTRALHGVITAWWRSESDPFITAGISQWGFLPKLL